MRKKDHQAFSCMGAHSFMKRVGMNENFFYDLNGIGNVSWVIWSYGSRKRTGNQKAGGGPSDPVHGERLPA